MFDPYSKTSMVAASPGFQCFQHARGYNMTECIGDKCPLWLRSPELCASGCAKNPACLAYTVDKGGRECRHLRRALIKRSKTNGSTYGVTSIACRRTSPAFSTNWLKYIGLTGQYRLSDIMHCSTEVVAAFYCGGLGLGSLRRQWPLSIGRLYAEDAGQPRDIKVLQRAVQKRASMLNCSQASMLPLPSTSDCVFHLRLGEIFKQSQCIFCRMKCMLWDTEFAAGIKHSAQPAHPPTSAK